MSGWPGVGRAKPCEKNCGVPGIAGAEKRGVCCAILSRSSRGVERGDAIVWYSGSSGSNLGDTSAMC